MAVEVVGLEVGDAVEEAVVGVVVEGDAERFFDLGGCEQQYTNDGCCITMIA